MNNKISEESERVVQIWKNTITEILTRGNKYTGFGSTIPVFSTTLSKEEKIVLCLVKIKSAKENKNWQYSWGVNSEPYIKDYNNLESDKLPVVDLFEQAKSIISKFEEKTK